jgi:ABC-type transporter Mla subunit MlaD
MAFDEMLSQANGWMQQLTLERVQAWIVDPTFNTFWCGITAAYFAICLLLLVVRVLRLRGALARVARPLRKVDSLEGFAREFESYREAVIRVKPLRHPWQEFVESLIPPREGEELRVRNTQEPSAYFNDATVVQPILHNRFFDTVPSHLVGLGILGTFLGLAAGVGLASGDLNAEDPKLVQAALSKLLSGASLAFVTSIFGLGFSLIFLFIERFLVGSVHRRLDGWVAKLEACVKLVTPEEIALEQLQQEKRQTKQLENFNDQLVFSLEQAFDNAVTQRLAPALDQVVQAINALRVDRADSNEAALERLVREFLEKLSGSAGREMEQIQVTLQTLTTRLGEMTEGLQEASRGLAAQISGAGAEIQASGRTTADGLTASIQPFTEAIKKFQDATGAHAELASRIGSLTDGLRNAGETVVEAHRGFQASLDPMRGIASGMEAAGGRLAGALEQTNRAVTQVTDIVSAIQAEQESISAAWQEYTRRFGDVDQALQRAFERLNEGVDRYAEKVREFHTEIDKNMSKGLQGLAAAIEELDESIEGLGSRVSPDRR